MPTVRTISETSKEKGIYSVEGIVRSLNYCLEDAPIRDRSAWTPSTPLAVQELVEET